MSDDSDHAIAILLLYGNVTEYGGDIIAFNGPGTTDEWLKLNACSIHNIVKGWIKDAVLNIEDGQ